MKRILRSVLIALVILTLLISGKSCSKPSTETLTTPTTEVDYTNPLITGADWNNMTLSQKEAWVDTALDAMMRGGELEESERQPAIYYVGKLDEVFYEPSNEKTLVSWELTASTAPTPASAPTPTVGGLEAERYTDTYYGYSILYPKDWSIKSSELVLDQVEIYAPNSSSYIIISPHYRTSDPLSEFVAQLRSIYEDTMGYEILSRGNILEDDLSEGCIDLITSGDALVSRGIITIEEHLYMKAKPDGWALKVVVGCFIQEYDDRNKDLFYDVITSFRLLD